MRRLEIGLVLPMEESWTDGSTPRWVEIRELALRAEAIGFDTVWVPDELLWRPPDGRGARLVGVRRDDRRRGGRDLAGEGRHVDPVRAPPEPRDHREGRRDAR